MLIGKIVLKKTKKTQQLLRATFMEIWQYTKFKENLNIFPETFWLTHSNLREPEKFKQHLFQSRSPE